jgi:hypothetical protein
LLQVKRVPQHDGVKSIEAPLAPDVCLPFADGSFSCSEENDLLVAGRPIQEIREADQLSPSALRAPNYRNAVAPFAIMACTSATSTAPSPIAGATTRRAVMFA